MGASTSAPGAEVPFCWAADKEEQVSDAEWAIIGVVVGGALTGLFSYALQMRQFAHTKEMFLLRHQSREVVKGLLLDMLSHESFTDRSYAALKRPIGGYTDESIRQLLHEVGARRLERADGTEWWYLMSRGEERLAKRANQ
ncbi:MAG: hypothetical protein R2910_05500 [Gemmatimonadales bacterium]